MKPNKNTTRVCIVLAVVLAVFCVVAFALPFVKNGVFWVSLIMGVVAIAAQLYVMKTAFAKGEGARSKFYGWPIARVGVIYLAAQLVLSLLFMGLAKWMPLWVVIVVCAVLLGAAVIGFIATDATRDEIERQDVKLKKDVTAMRDLQSKARAMVGQLDGEAGKALEELSDKLRYSDPVSSDAVREIEEELAKCLDTLQQAVVDGDHDAVLTLCRKASLTLAERNRLCKLNK